MRNSIWIARASRRPCRHQRALAVVLTSAVVAVPTTHALAADLPATTGFDNPYSGVPRYEKLAPRQVVSAKQLNRPLGMQTTHRIARSIGLKKRQAFTHRRLINLDDADACLLKVHHFVANREGDLLTGGFRIWAGSAQSSCPCLSSAPRHTPVLRRNPPPYRCSD